MDKLSLEDEAIIGSIKLTCEYIVCNTVGQETRVKVTLHPLKSEREFEEYKNARAGNTLKATLTQLATESVHSYTKRYDLWLEVVCLN